MLRPVSVLVYIFALFGFASHIVDAGEDLWDRLQRGSANAALARGAGASQPPPAWILLWRGDETEVHDEHSKTVEHVVVPRETIHQIAVRYGVSTKQLKRWNRLKRSRLRTGQRLEVRAHRIPPPKEKIVHLVTEGETWGSVAASYRISTKDLHGWNWRTKELVPGTQLAVWYDPGRPWTVMRKLGPTPPEGLDIRKDGQSIGRPDRGRIKKAVELPESPSLYTKRQAGGLWGSSHTIEQLVTGIANFRRDSGFEGELVIGALSRRGGGRFPPHRSHQSGRDVDIRLPLLPGAVSTHDPHPAEVDWHAAWCLVEALHDLGTVNVIFLDIKLQRRLYEAARALGVSHDELRELVQWTPNSGREPIVRHSRGHTGHIHVRFECGPDEPRCKKRRLAVRQPSG